MGSDGKYPRQRRQRAQREVGHPCPTGGRGRPPGTARPRSQTSLLTHLILRLLGVLFCSWRGTFFDVGVIPWAQNLGPPTGAAECSGRGSFPAGVAAATAARCIVRFQPPVTSSSPSRLLKTIRAAPWFLDSKPSRQRSKRCFWGTFLRRRHQASLPQR